MTHVHAEAVRNIKSVMVNKTKVIVTGGAEFIGSDLTGALFDRGFEVHVIDNLSGGKKENVNSKTVLHKCNFAKLDKIKPIFLNTKYVFHFVALPRVQF
jgi:UDP-glucose 4-epimerase